MPTKDDTPKVIDLMDLSPENLKVAETAVKNIIRHEKKRAEINADINAERKTIIALGVPAAALAASLARYKMDPEQREEFDMGRQFVDKALGIPVQADLFDEAEEAQERVSKKDSGGIPSGLEAVH